MVLAMSRTWKHPKTGIYWLRKGVPDDLRTGVGKREEKFRLKTRDPLSTRRKSTFSVASSAASIRRRIKGPGVRIYHLTAVTS